MNCGFNLEHYFHTLELAKTQGYKIKTVSESKLVAKKKQIILRHDVDFTLDYALKMAKAEHEHGIHSTYYILLRDDYYNPLSKRNIKIIKEITNIGHEIGLHYDSRFSTSNAKLKNELNILGDLIDKKITTIAAHTPNAIKAETGKGYIDDEINLQELGIIESKYNIDGIKYISDSSRIWREGCMCQNIGKYNNLQILTHPVWWVNNTNSIHEQMIHLKTYFIEKYNEYIKDYKKMSKMFMFNNNISKERYKI